MKISDVPNRSFGGWYYQLLADRVPGRDEVTVHVIRYEELPDGKYGRSEQASTSADGSLVWAAYDPYEKLTPLLLLAGPLYRLFRPGLV